MSKSAYPYNGLEGVELVPQYNGIVQIRQKQSFTAAIFIYKKRLVDLGAPLRAWVGLCSSYTCNTQIHFQWRKTQNIQRAETRRKNK
jgi:hypothetical protein